MVVRLGLVLSALVVVAGIVYATLARSETPRDLDWIGPWVAVWFGGIALALIWLGVLVALVVTKAARAIGDAGHR